MSGLYTSSRTRALKLISSAAAAACVSAGFVGVTQASPYASNVVVSGTTVNFILNENADALTYSINGGAALPVPTGTAKGSHSFTLGSPTDTFAISAAKTGLLGYGIPNLSTVAGGGNALFLASNGSGFDQLTDDTNPLNNFNSPRGVDVSKNPNSPNFGTVYIANSAAIATPFGPGLRASAGDGLYALRADQTDAYGYGDTAQDPGNFYDAVTASANSPYHVTVGPAGHVYGADWSDANGGVYRASHDLATGEQVLAGVGGVAPLPAGQNHGSVASVHVEGDTSTNNLALYTIDEDITSNHLFGSGPTNDQNSLWRYDINGNTLPFASNPTKAQSVNAQIPVAETDMNRGADGKWYVTQYRAGALNSATLYVLSADGSQVLFNSMQETRRLLNDPAANRDILQFARGSAVSPDQKWLAFMLNNNDVAVFPLINGIPDITQRLVVDTGSNTVIGREIAFDAAGNIHYVSSGTSLYRALGEGGTSYNTTAFDGTSYSFNSNAGLYWDINGTTAGGGGAAPAGAWNGGSQNFNTDSTGGAAGIATAVTTPTDDVIFTAGTDGSGTYTVTVGSVQSARSVNIARGNVTFSGGSVDTSNFDVAAGATAVVNSSVTGGISSSITKAGEGTLRLNDASYHTAGTTVHAGTLEIPNMHFGNPVFIKNGGTLRIFESSPDYSSGFPSGNPAFVSQPLFLNIAAGGTLDITNNDVIVDYTGTSPAADLEALVRSAYNVVGTWDGAGITSSIAAIDGNYVVAIADNAALAAPFGSAAGGPLFNGVDVDLDTVLIKFTHRADINLDGIVDASDSAIFGANYSENDPATWATGDLDYDGIYTPSDAAIFGTFYDESLGNLPEPGALSVLGLGVMGLARRRRSRSA